MAVIVLGLTCCPLCGKVLKASDPLVTTSHFMTDPFHPLWPFSDAAMHKSCFLQWERREEFVRLYNDASALRQFESDASDRMLEDGEIVARSPGARIVAEQQERRRTALHAAAETGSITDILARLEADPPEINTPDEAGVTPLHEAVA